MVFWLKCVSITPRSRTAQNLNSATKSCLTTEDFTKFATCLLLHHWMEIPAHHNYTLSNVASTCNAMQLHSTYIKTVHYTVSVVFLTYIGLHCCFMKLLLFFSGLWRVLWAICTFISLAKEPDDHIWLSFFLFHFIWELGTFALIADCFVLTHWLKCNVK